MPADDCGAGTIGDRTWLMRLSIAIALVCAALGVATGCGEQDRDAPAVLPRSGTAYRALDDDGRLAVAKSCRDQATNAASGVAADELSRVDPGALRAQLDAAFAIIRDQRRPVAELCAEKLPFVTPGLRVRFDGAKDSGDAFTYETNSDEPLAIKGSIAPVQRYGTVVARREFGRSKAHAARIGADGRFALPSVRLRKVADNSFIVVFDVPPHAPRKTYFSAICLDCLAAGPPPIASD
jgi:hypothetical protein